METLLGAAWPKVGAALSFIGTAMVAFSFGANPEGAYQSHPKGHKIYLASFSYPLLFKSGMFLIALGFLVQIIA